MAVLNEDSAGVNLPYTPQVTSPLTGAAIHRPSLFFAMWRDSQGDGRMRPGDWLVLLIGSVLIIIIVSALVFL
jgi:hypothetical protein